ncbi:MAG TPA: paraquat-inducible protein A [Acetobacteraceae bacterium]|nr:paraquat-inducible protein A [Acetobacteraceae bacterium]
MSEHGHILRGERECQDCGLFQDVPPLVPGDAACCRRCGATLRYGHRDSLTRCLACTLGALLLFIVALQLPLMSVFTVGRDYRATLFSGPTMLDQRGMWEISLVVLLTLVVMPAVQLALMLAVLLGLRLPQPPRILPTLFGFVERIRPWSMIEVFLLGSFVAYTRLQAIGDVDVGPALFALGGMMLCLIGADAVLDHEAVWEELEARGLLHLRTPPATDRRIGCDCCRLVLTAPSLWPCPRCGRRLRQRKRQSIVRTWALLSAATVLYVPANLYPIITVIRFGDGEPSTIWQGVVELVQLDMLPLALLVFLASITVPLLKLTGLTAMLLMTHDRSPALLVSRTRLYRLIDSVGRWSMIDVFMLTILVALVHMGFVATVLPGPGAIAFASVVILTMFAAAAFDPRLMWDAAEAGGHVVAMRAENEVAETAA